MEKEAEKIREREREERRGRGERETKIILNRMGGKAIFLCGWIRRSACGPIKSPAHEK